MASKKRNLNKITVEQILNIERAARRKVDIELGVTQFKSKAHRMATDYNRRQNKRINLNED
jgi:isopentenyldiphosphate isomerase